MIEYIHIKWYRSIKDKKIEFKPWINLLIWENDAGKSSILNCIKFFSQDYSLSFDKDDFHHFFDWTKEVVMPEIMIEIKFFEKTIEYIKKESGEEWFHELIDINQIKSEINIKDEDQLKVILKMFWWSILWKQTIDWMKAKIIAKIDEILKTWITIQKFPISKSSFLEQWNNIKYQDGKHFEKINDHFKNFVKDQINTIWDTSITTDKWEKTLRNIVDANLNTIKDVKKKDYKENLLPVLKEILPWLIDLDINIESQLWNFNTYNISIDFRGTNSSINMDKKWDWTKRRITLSLFKFESEKEATSKVYLFDEPDTHLHIKAQQDLYEIIDKLKTSSNQIIFTSHSPYLLNLLQLSHIQLVENENWETKVKNFQSSENDQFEWVLSALWIQNIHIFFTKYFVFVEWDTEEQFFTRTLFNKYGTTFERKFAKIINAEWVSHEAIFADHLHRILWKDIKIIFIVDSDYTKNTATKKIIDALHTKFSTSMAFIALWKKEFEDLFNIDDLYVCFEDEFTKASKTKIDIQKLLDSPCKFSEALSWIIWITKPQIWIRLSEYYKDKGLPNDIQTVIDRINSLS